MVAASGGFAEQVSERGLETQQDAYEGHADALGRRVGGKGRKFAAAV